MSENNQKSLLWTQRELNGKTERVLNIFIPHVSGISNRIKQIFTYLHFYEYIEGYTVDLHWPLCSTASNTFKELFDFKLFPRFNEINYDIYTDNNYGEGNTWCLLINKEEAKKANMKYIDLKYNEIPQFLRDAFLSYFRALKPSLPVQQILDSVEIPENSVSVHIRHDAVWRYWKRWADNDIDMFIDAMNKYDKDTYFLLACADQEIYEMMLKTFKDRIISIPNKKVDNTSNIQDVAELYLLSKGKELIATYGSTFSEVAWWLSDCSQEVTVIGSEEAWQKLAQS